jgi:hypothetical protein
MAEIHTVFNQPGTGFVTLPAGSKFPPPYKEWQKPENARTFAQAQEHAAKGGNVGALAGNGHIGLDKDDPAAFDGLELPITTTWETRTGRFGMRFEVSDDVATALAAYGKKAELAQLYLFKDGRKVGEVKLQRSYQTIPPSWKTLEDGTRADYKLLDSSPPATITLAKLLADLQAIGIIFNEKPKASRLEANAAKLEDRGKKAHQRRIETDETKTRRYAEAALRDEVLLMAGTPPGSRNEQLNKSAFALGQFVAAKMLSEEEVISKLSKAASNTGLDSDEIRTTIISGMEAGRQHPRKIPEQPTNVNGPKDEPESAEDHCSNGKDSAATAIVKMVIQSGAELWHTPKEDFYISFKRNGHIENHPMKNKAVKLWLGALFFKTYQKAPGSQALKDALTILEAHALMDGATHEDYVRVAPYEDRIYVDLGDPTWRAVEITKHGWSIVDTAPVRFWRPRSMLPLPEPARGGKWDDLRKIINAKSKRNWILAVAWAVQVFWPSGPYAHLNFSGEQGTGKTIAQIIFKLLLDPSVTPLRRPPKEEKDLMIAARNERAPSFDNLSGMPDHLSDAFCGLSTGVALASRSLYTDDEEAFLSARRPCIMNGIDTLTNRGDLLDRTIINELPRIKPNDRVLEKKIMKAFERVRPQLLGLFLDATATGLRRQNEIDETDLPRMADFCAWVLACEPSLPWQPGEFMIEYLGSIESSFTSLVESDQVARAVYEMALEHAQTRKTFSGTATDLLDLLNQRKYIDPNRQPKGWPRTPNTLSSRLRRVAPALRALKVQIEWSKLDRNTKTIDISLAETISETIRDDPLPKDRLQEPARSGSGDARDDGDDLLPLSQLELLSKFKRGDEKRDEIGRLGRKTVSVVSSSPSGPKITVLGETIPNVRSSPIVSRSSPSRVCAACGEDLTGHGTVEKGGKVYCARPGCGYPPRERAEAA